MPRKMILSIDAGGIRCLIPAMVLADLLRRMRASGRKLPMSRYIDMFAGAGVGSILIASLAYPLLTKGTGASDPDGILREFVDAAKLFPKRIKTSSGAMRLDASLFEAYLRNRYGEKTLVADSTTHVVMPAFDIAGRMPLIISNLDAVTAQFYLWQALRGTVAVVPYMSPALVENRAMARARGTPLIPIVSGGRYAEDPALAAYVEARNLGWREEDITLLSLGAGFDLPPLPFINTQSNGGLDMTDVTEPLLRFADELHCPIANHVNMLMNGNPRSFNGLSTRMTAENRRRLNYFRINRRVDEANYSKINFDAANMDQLRAEAMRMIEENAAILDEVVSRMPTDLELLAKAARPGSAPLPRTTGRAPADREPPSRQNGMPIPIAEYI